jgi:putative transcriptional regulator
MNDVSQQFLGSQSLQGQLLLASPSLREGIFYRSVILISEHTPKGSSGIILNIPSHSQVGQLVTDKRFYPLRNMMVYCGGPVDPENLYFSRLWWDVTKGLAFDVQIPAEEAIFQSHRSGSIVLAFMGYAAWNEGQLEKELQENTWIIHSPTPELLGRNYDSTLWIETLRSISTFHRILAEAPKNPSAN